MNIYLLKYTNFLVHNLIKLNLKHSYLLQFLRSQHVNISPHVSKIQAEAALRKILFNDQVIDAFCTKFKRELAINPVELEILLGCSRSERLRWTKEKKLPVIYFTDVYKFGSHLMCPMYDRRIIGLKKTDEILAEWRNEWIRRRRKKYFVGDKQNVIKTSILKNAYFKHLNQLCDKWYGLDEELGITFELAWWTSILSYWIQTRRERSNTSRMHYYRHKSIENFFIDLRSLLLTTLLKSKYAMAYKYEPKVKDRYSLHLCDEHNGLVKINDQFISCHEWFYINPRPFLQCKNCHVVKRENYYSYVVVEVKSKLDEEFLFTFYVPASFFPLNDIETIHKKRWNNGAYRLGREIIKNDIYVPSEQITLKTLKILLKRAKMFFAKKTS